MQIRGYNEKTKKYGLNPILNCDKGQIKKKYRIDTKEIEKGGMLKCLI